MDANKTHCSSCEHGPECKLDTGSYATRPDDLTCPYFKRKDGKVLVEIIKHTDVTDARRAIEFTTGGRFQAKATLASVYGWNHSLTRTQMFSVMMYRIPTFVSVHFVRHKIGVEHFVQSNRPDRDGDAKADRLSPVNHLMFCNAESLINMSHRRLCYQASTETRFVMSEIQSEMLKADPDLVRYMVPLCQYRGGICSEPKPCGEYKVKRFGGDR